MEAESKEDEAHRCGSIARLRRSGRNRESQDEIAELEAELRRAYIAKELQAQLLEREAERYAESVRRRRAEEVQRLDQREVVEDDLRRRFERLKKRADYGKELTAQMEQRNEERSALKEEARKEREVLAEVDRIREERERTRGAERRSELVDSTRRGLLILEEMRLIRREEDAEAEARKRREDEEYSAEIAERKITAESLRREREKKREATVREITSLLMNGEAEKREREALLAELIAEDVKLELAIKEDEERTRREKLREDLVTNLAEQIALTERCKLRAVELDRAFGEEIMRRIMEDEATARLTAEARRRVQVQYREDLARLIDTRRRIREEESQNARRVQEEEKRSEEARIQRVAAERTRLLREHASSIAGFVDKNVLSEEERRILEEFSRN